MLGTIGIAPRRSVWAQAADRLDPTSEVYRQERERDEAYGDIRKFARHCWIQEAEGEPAEFARVGWGWQFALLFLWFITKLTVVLKARQLGVSWLAAMYALWVAIRRPGQSVLLISRRQDDADKLLAKVTFIWERLPAWKPDAIANTRSIRFPGLDSEIEALPATENIGRSRTANLVVLDEHAHQPFARKILLAVKAAAEYGQIISISSANGHGALHSQLYEGSKRGNPMAPTQLPDRTPLPVRVTRGVGPNGWRGVFIPFSAHPRRDDAWRAQARAELEDLSDAEFTQEYPRDDVEAIQQTGSPVFDFERLRAQNQRIGRPIVGLLGAAAFEVPLVGARYAIGADPAEGNADSDWSSAMVLRITQEDGDGYSAEQVAMLRGRWAPEVFATKLDQLARHFSLHAKPGNLPPVLLAWERNNHGHAVRVALEEIEKRGPLPYAMYKARDRKRGWLQTTESRTLLVDQLAAAVRTGRLVLHDAETLDQFFAFHENEKGKPEAADGFHDDDVIAGGLGWQLRRMVYGRVIGLPQRGARAA